MVDEQYKRGSGDDGKGGGGANVGFSGFTYTDGNQKNRADIELIDDKGGSLKKLTNQPPNGGKTAVNGVTGVNKMDVKIKNDKGKQIHSGSKTGSPTGKNKTLHYFSEADIDVEGALTIDPTEVEDDKNN